MDGARKILHWLREGTIALGSTTHELHAITNDVDALPSFRRSFVALSLSLFREPALRARLWRAFLLQFLAQMCGAASMKYYVHSLLEALA